MSDNVLMGDVKRGTLEGSNTQDTNLFITI